MRYMVVVVAFLIGCTRPNPRACQEGECIDPALPFCDSQGTLGGLVNECIAVSCAPGEFAECRGDVAVVCDATGMNYSLQQCIRGCRAEWLGCAIDPSNGLGGYLDMVESPPDIELVTATIDIRLQRLVQPRTIPSSRQIDIRTLPPARQLRSRRCRA